MTNEQFLQQFSQHLNVGGRQREEIIAELVSHLKEEAPEKLGDPILLARKSNRVHLGVFSSFSRLLIVRLISFLLLEFGWLMFYLKTYAGSMSGQPSWIFPLNVVAQMTPAFLLVYGSWLLGHFKHRWLYIIVWASTFTLGLTLIDLVEQAMGYLLKSNVDGSPVTVWQNIGGFIALFLLYAAITAGIMLISNAKNILFPRHRVIATIIAGVIVGAAGYFAVPLLWNVVTNYHYTENMVPIGEWLFTWRYTIGIGFGLLGGASEWMRHTRLARFKL